MAERLVRGKHVGPAFKFSRTGGGGIGFGHEAAVSLNRWCTFRYAPGGRCPPDEYRILAFWGGNPGTNTRAGGGVAFIFTSDKNVITYQTYGQDDPMRRNVMPLMTVALASAVLAPLPAARPTTPQRPSTWPRGAPGSHRHQHRRCLPSLTRIQSAWLRARATHRATASATGGSGAVADVDPPSD